MSNILAAAVFAAHAHGKQMRKGREVEPYIVHPLRVAKTVSKYFPKDDGLIMAALLHDVLEDTAVTPSDMKEFGPGVVNIVMELTDREGGTFGEGRKQAQIVRMASASRQARIVKVADQLDNIKDVANNPPVKWSFDKRRQYVNMASAVVAATNIGSICAELAAEYDHAYVSAMHAINAQEEIANG